jgi:hypothetical protein
VEKYRHLHATRRDAGHRRWALKPAAPASRGSHVQLPPFVRPPVDAVDLEPDRVLRLRESSTQCMHPPGRRDCVPGRREPATSACERVQANARMLEYNQTTGAEARGRQCFTGGHGPSAGFAQKAPWWLFCLPIARETCTHAWAKCKSLVWRRLPPLRSLSTARLCAWVWVRCAPHFFTFPAQRLPSAALLSLCAHSLPHDL